MKNTTLKAMVIGLAAAMTLTCVAPAAVFASPVDDDLEWLDVVDDDDFDEFDEDEDYDDFDDDEDYDDEDDYDDEEFVEIISEEETGRDIVNNSHAGYSYANCRENPGLDSDVLFTVPNGTRVYTTGRVAHKDGFDWYEVHLAGAYDYGWIAGHLIGR